MVFSILGLSIYLEQIANSILTPYLMKVRHSKPH
nr:MAG TPA: hypothetical protein [Caudoviricetes sp.]DAR41173.1 MAG TPA: hypothetical protein [Caudoviricetes sp.]